MSLFSTLVSLNNTLARLKLAWSRINELITMDDVTDTFAIVFLMNFSYI